jgi:hypothetical protein
MPLEILDHLKHSDLPMTLDKGLELVRNFVELLRRHVAGKYNLVRLGVVIFLIGSMGLIAALNLRLASLDSFLLRRHRHTP